MGHMEIGAEFQIGEPFVLSVASHNGKEYQQYIRSTYICTYFVRVHIRYGYNEIAERIK